MKGTFLCAIFMSLLFCAGFESFNSLTPTIPDLPTETKDTNDAFNTVMQVVLSPRCLNCHPSGDQPTQGDDLHEHYFNVQRGSDDHGAGILKCQTCHQNENNDYTGVPGAPNWHLAPKSMGWQGLNKYQVAKAMLDPNKNGGRGLDSLLSHLTEDPLVLWAFEPGINQLGQKRSLPPVSKEEYIEAVEIWIGSGATIPNNN